jgi:hypothetical protein
MSWGSPVFSCTARSVTSPSTRRPSVPAADCGISARAQSLHRLVDVHLQVKAPQPTHLVGLLQDSHRVSLLHLGDQLLDALVVHVHAAQTHLHAEPRTGVVDIEAITAVKAQRRSSRVTDEEDGGRRDDAHEVEEDEAQDGKDDGFGDPRAPPTATGATRVAWMSREGSRGSGSRGPGCGSS